MGGVARPLAGGESSPAGGVVLGDAKQVDEDRWWNLLAEVGERGGSVAAGGDPESREPATHLPAGQWRVELEAWKQPSLSSCGRCAGKTSRVSGEVDGEPAKWFG